MCHIDENITRVNFDTKAIFYFLENEGEVQIKIVSPIYILIEHNAKLYICEIGIAECFYGAFKSKSQALEKKYSQLFFEENLFEIIPVDFDFC
jgi:predicted nucleic acid-binding protein